jgi:hypothetical protein
MTTTDGPRNTMTPLNPRYTDMQRAIRYALTQAQPQLQILVTDPSLRGLK